MTSSSKGTFASYSNKQISKVLPCLQSVRNSHHYFKIFEIDDECMPNT